MSLKLTLTPSLPLHRHTSGVPWWKRLLSVADTARMSFQTLWSQLFLDARVQLREAPLDEALALHPLEARAVISQVWERTVEEPARQLLPPLSTQVITDAARVMTPTLSQLVGPHLGYTTGLPETAQWVQQYVGAQIRDITATTRQAVQQILREGWQAGTAPHALARQLREVLGVTPRQRQTLDRLRARLTEQGMAPMTVERQIARATQRAVQIRAEVIARTETLALSNRGSYETLLQSVRRSYVEADRVRRHWSITAGACAICIAIAERYPNGVGLHDAFEGPDGPILTPPSHPQ
jgi:hypothetical protein